MVEIQETLENFSSHLLILQMRKPSPREATLDTAIELGQTLARSLDSRATRMVSAETKCGEHAPCTPHRPESTLKKMYLFIYSFLPALGLHCCTRAFSSCRERGLLFVVVRGLLIVVASLVVEHRLSPAGFRNRGMRAQ